MLSNEDITSRLGRTLNSVKPGVQFESTGHLRKDIKLDSLDVMMFLFEVEKDFGIKIPEEDVDQKELLVITNLVAYVKLKTVEEY